MNKNLDKILSWKEQGLKIVFTNGCFDILHRGHVDYLEKAAAFGDKLVIGLNSDSSVKRIKGPDRPVQDQEDRLTILAALRYVDLVILFDEDTPLDLIRSVKPDILVKGGDYSFETIVGAQEVTASGGEVKVVPLTQGKGTTDIITKIHQL